MAVGKAASAYSSPVIQVLLGKVFLRAGAGQECDMAAQFQVLNPKTDSRPFSEAQASVDAK